MKAMKAMKATLLAATVSAVISGQALAVELITFSPNTPAKAADVNANFQYLESKINGSAGAGESVDIDCGKDAAELKNYLAEYRVPGSLTFNVSGQCDGPVVIVKDDVKIVGGTIVAGSEVGLPGGSKVSLLVNGQKNIELKNITIESGAVNILQGASVLFDNVALPETFLDSDEEYLPNVDMRSSNLRITSGSLDNLSLRAWYNSNITFESGLLGEATQILLNTNSTLDSYKLNHLTVSHFIDIEANSSLDANAITVNGAEEGINVDYSGHLSATDVNLVGELGIESSSTIEIDGDFTANNIRCSNSALEFEGNLTLTGNDGDQGMNSFDAVRGCHAVIEGAYEHPSVTGDDNQTNYIDKFSSIFIEDSGYIN